MRENAKNYNQNLIITLYPNESPDVSIITYGGSVSIAIEAAEKLFMKNEIIVNVIVLSSVRPIDKEWIFNNLSNCGKFLILEEGNRIGGWGAEVVSILNEEFFDILEHPILRIGAEDIPIPSSGPMEREVLPSSKDLIKKISLMINS